MNYLLFGVPLLSIPGGVQLDISGRTGFASLRVAKPISHKELTDLGASIAVRHSDVYADMTTALQRVRHSVGALNPCC